LADTPLKTSHNFLLFIDGIINIILGIFLLLFPSGIARPLGLPIPATCFYPVILGAVLFGLGIALLVERYCSRNISGLGLGGAIVINLCGSLALITCLILIPLEIPFRGQLLLWSIAILVLAVGIIELINRSWNQGKSHTCHEKRSK
jgi:uncharacterized membrane protein HdeD (DUF308 family)